MWLPSMATVRLQWPDVLEEIDERSAFQTEDPAKRAVVIRDRFAVLRTKVVVEQYLPPSSDVAESRNSRDEATQTLLHCYTPGNIIV